MTPTEECVAALWTEALGAAPEDVGTDFFAAGGTSLNLVRMLAGVQDTWGVELPLDRLFTEGFTVRGAAAAVDELLLGALDADELRALEAELDGMSEEELSALLADSTSAGGGAGVESA
ncbi:phosphopantetheine-binding protein [Streptomyces sp. NPDC057806]|uniref:phosphopantetheine-binding protein n=1 Tax=unclassified Streptomyces TaxID=2593676 RepID=UPI003684250B